MVKVSESLMRFVASVMLMAMSLSAVPIVAMAADAPAVTSPTQQEQATAKPGREITPDFHRSPAWRNAMLNLFTNLQALWFRARFLLLAENYGGLRTAGIITLRITAVTNRIGSMAGWEDLSGDIIEMGFFRLFYNDLGYSRQNATNVAVTLRQLVEYAMNNPQWFNR